MSRAENDDRQDDDEKDTVCRSVLFRKAPSEWGDNVENDCSEQGVSGTVESTRRWENVPRVCAETSEFTRLYRAATLPPTTTYYEVRSNVPEEFRGAIRAAFDTWENEGEDLEFRERDGADNYVEWVSLPEYPPDLAGTVNYVATPTEIQRFRIRFNENQPWDILDPVPECFPYGDKVDVESLATHEVGHAIGLGHTNSIRSTGLTMFPFYFDGSTVKRTLGEGDLRGVHTLYGEET